MGGGNGMPQAVLAGLKKYPVKLSAVSAMLDSGGSAGRERRYFKTKVAFGDLRRVALALAEVSNREKERFAYRYQNCPLAGQVLANLYCTVNILVDSVPELISDLKEDLKISKDHQLLPATFDDAHLCVELENGQIIEGEGNIDIPKHNGNLKIKKAFLKPRAKAYPKALQVIKKADLITIGPGDLFSSLAQILLIEGISEAIRKSKAKKVYICNLMTKYGETNNFKVKDFVDEIEGFLGGPLDFVIYNTKKPSIQRLTLYKKEHPELLELVEGEIFGKRFIGTDVITSSGPVVHDPNKLAKIIIKLL